MNGRIYDYNLGRFLSVDPIIQSPGNSQSLNPYSYIMNNPLAGTDPSGYSACGATEVGDTCNMDSISVDQVDNIEVHKDGSAVVNTTDGKSFKVEGNNGNPGKTNNNIGDLSQGTENLGSPSQQNKSAVVNGQLQGDDITQKRFENLENGDMDEVNALVLHQTGADTGQSTLNSWENGNEYGTHFLIDENGNIYQTASLDKQTQHVGAIKPRCSDEGSCSAADKKALNQIDADKRSGKIKSWGKWRNMRGAHEAKKDYPSRYPRSADSVGIEIASAPNKDGTYPKPNDKQMTSLKSLVGRLQKHYGLKDSDVYSHAQIAGKKDCSQCGY